MCRKGRGGRRGRQLKAHREAVVLDRKRGGDDGMVWVLRVALSDGGGPLRRHGGRGLGWHKTGTSSGLGEVTCT